MFHLQRARLARTVARLCGCAAALAGVLGDGAAAQITIPSPAPVPVLASPAQASEGIALPQLRPRGATGSGTPLEGALDPAAYVVGPGDVFTFTIGGSVPVQQQAAVAADGMLIVPELGSFAAAGRTLAAVKADLRAALRRFYRNVPTDAVLSTPRQFYVHVSGAVERPGRHVAVPIARVEDALAEAMGGTPPAEVLRARRQADPRAFLPALRNVEVRHRDGTLESVDLLRYYATADTDFNPYLRDGDALFVPVFQVAGQAVTVEDRFDPHAYDLRPGDTVADLLVIARGERPLSEAEAVRLIRPLPDGRIETRELDAAALARGEAATVALRPLDRLLIVDPNVRLGAVAVEGAVVYPGTYPLLEGETTLREVLEQAGGLRPDGFARGAYLERRGTSADPDPVADTQSLDAAGRAVAMERGVFEGARLSSLPFTSRQYLAREALGFQRLSLDLEAVLRGDGAEIRLQDGDRLVVPQDPGGVLVLGQVRRPGLVAYRPGADAEAYVAAAGGRGPAATEVYLSEAGTGLLLPAEDAEVREGDYLFVDRAPTADTPEQQQLLLQERQDQRQDRRDVLDARYRFVGTVISAVGTVISAVALYIALSDSSTGS